MYAFGRAVARVLMRSACSSVATRGPRARGSNGSSQPASRTNKPCAVLLGVVPTPAIAFAAAAGDVPALIVSASHNPWRDNGVKVIGADGRKFVRRRRARPRGRPARARLRTGHPNVDSASAEALLDRRRLSRPSSRFARQSAGSRAARRARLRQRRDVLLGPRVFRELGAASSVLHDEPNGRNINEACGSTHPESLAGGRAQQRCRAGPRDRRRR